MLALHARYRGRSTRRAEYVQRSAAALNSMDGVGGFRPVGVEDIHSLLSSPRSLANVAMALLSDGDWAVGIGIARSKEEALDQAAVALPTSARRGVVYTSIIPDPPGTASQDISAVFAMLSHVLIKRTTEGREATALVRRGWNQNEAARTLGISKQAMSQRLQAAGWHAEMAGWQLAVNLLTAAEAHLSPSHTD